MPDILQSAQDTKLLPASKLEELDLPFSERGAPVPEEPEPAPTIPPPAPKKGHNRAALITLLLFLFTTLPLLVLFVSKQQQVANIKSRAGGWECGCPAGKTCDCIPSPECHAQNTQLCTVTGDAASSGSGGGDSTVGGGDGGGGSTGSGCSNGGHFCEGFTCANGTSYGSDNCYGGGDCSKRFAVCGAARLMGGATTTPPTSGGAGGAAGGGGGGTPTDDCWKGLLSPSDVGCTPGVQQCNGNLLAECQPQISQYCKVSYWKAVGTCSGGTPIPYAGTTVSPQPAGGTTTSGSCGGNGQSCCDPFSSGGKICDGALYCNTATGTCEPSKPTNLCQGSQGSGGQAGDLCEVFICPGKCDNGNQCTKSTGKVPCSQASLGGQCGQIDWLNTAGNYCGVKEQNCGGPCAGTQQSGGGAGQQQDTPQPTPTATIPAGAQCRNIKLYKDTTVITPSDLRPGDQITIAIVGDNATKARARVNGSAWTETTTKNAAGEFIIQFTVPPSGGTFTIEAEVHQNGVWQ